ncbi:hypothetical protein SLA2020_477230 [Shorea laevis]
MKKSTGKNQFHAIFSPNPTRLRKNQIYPFTPTKSALTRIHQFDHPSLPSQIIYLLLVSTPSLWVQQHCFRGLCLQSVSWNFDSQFDCA